MPELPEVETLCRQLQKIIVGASIRKIKIIDAKLGSVPMLAGRMVTAVMRRGKSIAIMLDDERTMCIHLRMTGRLLWQAETEHFFTPDYARMTIMFSNGRLHCIDPRRFATFHVEKPMAKVMSLFDPLEDIDIDRLKKIAGSRKITVKCLLLDQRFMAGIGNIYACEILHAAEIDPSRKAADLSREHWKRIVDVMKPILDQAISCRGTTVSDWRDLFGQPGEYQRYLKVYAKEECQCPVCHGQIRRIRLGGRGTYFCSSCQR